jgi:hypothetical protein
MQTVFDLLMAWGIVALKATACIIAIKVVLTIIGKIKEEKQSKSNI